MSSMFRNRKVQEFSYGKISKKFLTDRENLQRIKHLRYLIDNTSDRELKYFFTKNYSLIFNAFYDVFTNVQMELQQKVNTSHFKELQYILAVFEKILILLPELIQKKWQYNCIINILKLLVHHNNKFKIRSQGLQLFILWFQILGANAPKSSYDMFISLIPIFEPIITENICTTITSPPLILSESIHEMEMKPVLSQILDKEAEYEDINQYFLRCFLRHMITEGIKVEWEEKKDEKQLTSYTFIFDQFKEYFLPVIFPKCSSDYTIEKNMNQDIVSANFLDCYCPILPGYPIDGTKIFQYQAEVIQWMEELVCMDYSKKSTFNDVNLKMVDSIDEEKKDTLSKQVVQNSTFSNDMVLLRFDRDSMRIEDIVLRKFHFILLKNEENINIINQLCMHALYFPLQFYKTHISIISIYKSWLFSDKNSEFHFMIDSDTSSPVVIRGVLNVNDSSKKIISQTMQRVIFTNVASLFLHRFKEPLGNQVAHQNKNQGPTQRDLVKKIMSEIYMKAVNDISNLDYNHLMNVLLDISFTVLNYYSPSKLPEIHWIRYDECIRQLFKILNVILVKISMSTYISEQIWNRYLQVYSSLVGWVPIVTEWKITLEYILRMLGKKLYNVDMHDLPLEKKMKRARSVCNLKRNGSSKLVRKGNPNDDHSIQNISNVDPILSNTMCCNSSMRNPIHHESYISFTEELYHNCDEHQFFLEHSEHINSRIDTDNLNHDEANKNIQFDYFNENDVGSYDSSSNGENSSYVSAEESSSPHDQNKGVELGCSLIADNIPIPFSSIERDTRIELKRSLEIPIKQVGYFENEEKDIDADDEYECEVNNNIFCLDDERKSVTLTRSDSDIDISTQFYRTGANKNLHKSKFKAMSRRISYQTQGTSRKSMDLDDSVVTISTEEDFQYQVRTSENSNSHHVSLGGTSVDKNLESIVLLWKRFIGLLGNVTKITNPEIMLIILEFLSNLTDSLIKMRENMCIPNGADIAPKPPIYIPPIDYIVPWMFQVFNHDTVGENIKIVALRTICRITVRKMDIEPPIEHLIQFYNLIHSIVYIENMMLICSLIENLGVYLFSIPLFGLEVLILDIIKACKIILEKSNDSKNLKLPKVEAISILGSLLVLQDNYEDMCVFDPNSKSVQMVVSGSFKTNILQLLTSITINEPETTTRSLSIIISALYCYTKVMQPDVSTTDLNHIRQRILLLLRMMRITNSEISTISAEMIRFLVICFPQFQEKLPLIPEKIIQALSWTLNYLMMSPKDIPTFGLKKNVTTMIFALVDWCISMPLNQLLDSDDLHPKGLVHLAFSALEKCLKYDEISDTDKYVNMSSLKSNSINRIPNIELRRPSAIHSIPLSSNFNNGLFNDPLNELTSVFETQTIQDNDISIIPDISFDCTKVSEKIKLAAQTALCHLINHIGQFPKNDIFGSLSSCVNEHHNFRIDKVNRISDVIENTVFDELASDVFNSPDLQLFVVNASLIVSLLTIDTCVSSKSIQNTNQKSIAGGHILRNDIENTIKEPQVRLIVRDLSGKYCWDVNFIYKYSNDVSFDYVNRNKDIDSIPPSPPPRQTLPPVLRSDNFVTQKTMKKEKVSKDQLDLLLEDLFTLSPEIFPSDFINMAASDVSFINVDSLKQEILDYNVTELNYLDFNHSIKISHPRLSEKKLKTNITIEKPPDTMVPNSKFYFCRQILNHLGFLSLKHRTSIDLIQKSNIYRDLKCIDSLKSRETHKIAVLYVAWGQEDKNSILKNVEASLEFNSFINGLGWTINLETHKGFMGGLDSNGKNGKYAPYYANSTLEIIFHVSTWMQSSSIDDKPNKFIHLGNDEVMVIWSENYRNFRSNITKTEFGDVMIIIYPLRNGLYSISIKNKFEHKLFGPLFDGSIVGERDLPGLVRATAINAGRAIRESKPLYEDCFVARANYIQNAIKKFMIPMTFENFATNIYGTSNNQSDEGNAAITQQTVATENVKRTSFKTSDLSPATTLGENIPNAKGNVRLSSSPKSNQTIEDITDHIMHRKLSKNIRHIKGN